MERPTGQETSERGRRCIAMQKPHFAVGCSIRLGSGLTRGTRVTQPIRNHEPDADSPSRPTRETAGQRVGPAGPEPATNGL
jgi:hypothetical protein